MSPDVRVAPQESDTELPPSFPSRDIKSQDAFPADFLGCMTNDLITLMVKDNPLSAHSIEAHAHILTGIRASHRVVSIVQRDPPHLADPARPNPLGQEHVHPLQVPRGFLLRWGIAVSPVK